jgi:GNAT superfamily N-acetyltransferase
MVRDAPVPAGWAEAEPPAGVAFVPLPPRAGEALAAAWEAAYPPDHLDRVPGEVPLEYLSAMLEGRVVGPPLRASGVALAGERVAGAVIVTDSPARHSWPGGPWIADVFRDPEFPGTGTALLRRAIAAVAPRHVGLSVTDGNPVQALYERLGFAVTGSRRSTPRPIR